MTEELETTSSLPQAPGWDIWNRETFEQEMELHPAFRTQPLKEGEELPPLIQAMQSLKYDLEENSAEEVAEAYKVDGNHNFKLKKYRWAVENYTKGIEIKCKSDFLNAQLYANRAAAHFHIGNYKKAILDATESKKLKPDHLKAFHRGAMCCNQLQQWSDCISWCDEGLIVDPGDTTLIALKKEAEEKKKVADRNRRKALALEAKRKKELDVLKNVLKERHICLAEEDIAGCERPVHPALSDAMVHLKAGKLMWPVIFMYPEYGTTDYIKEFAEDASFMDHLSIMFDSENLPDWDKNGEYLAENLQMYFMDGDYIIPFEKTKTLGYIVSHSRYKVHSLTPCFTVTVRDSSFDQSFRNRYKLC